MIQMTSKNMKKKALFISMVTIFLGFSHIQLGNASDIQIYQNPSAANNPILMLAIDNSLSMTATDTTYQGSKVSRLDALKNSLKDALNAKDSSGNYKIPSNTYIGLSVFTSTGEVGTTADWGKTISEAYPRSSKILIEAKQLTSSHRADLINKINSISAVGSTPTPLLLSETFAYLLGNRTNGTNLDNLNSNAKTMYNNYTQGLSGSSFAPSGTKDSNGNYIAPLTKQNNTDAQCSTQGVFFLTDGAPVGIRPATAEPVMRNALNDQNFVCEGSPLEDVYYDYRTAKTNLLGAPAHNGEFKMMATERYLKEKLIIPDHIGNMTISSQITWQNRSSWACVGKMVQRLANQTQLTSTPNNKRIYTSTVGFGPLFQKHARETCTDINNDGFYDYCSFDDTYAASGTDVSNYMNAQSLKKLGDIGKGDTYGTGKEIGGYTYASSGEDIQNALNNFLQAVSGGNFEAASFGSYIVPTDQLSRGAAYPYVFAPQFQPKINEGNTSLPSTHKLWLGNLKKYAVNNNGVMIDDLNREVLTNFGSIRNNTRDLWNVFDSDDGSKTTLGGAMSQLLTPKNLSSVTAATQIITRPLFINATIETTGTNANKVVETNNGALTKLTTENVLNAKALDSSATGWKKNIYQPYLLSALGYKLEKSYLEGLAENYQWDSLAKVKSLPVMQQMGGVLHSDPLLVTLEAKYDSSTGQIKSNTASELNNRKDYIVYGSMQGILHMVNQETGKEEFAFLPNEIIQDVDHKNALLDQQNTQQNTANPYYGIDAPWVSDVQYNIDTANTKFYASKANLYGGMRMGGRSYYALDVKAPNNPSLLFHINPAKGTISSKNSEVTTTTSNPAIMAMGQSWSKPTIAKVRYNGVIKNVMIVGGGYDTAYETIGYQPSTSLAAGSANQGAGVYIFDADTGKLLWNARYGATNNVTSSDVKHNQMKYSVVSQIKAFDRNTDGLVDNLYFGDLGGQVWRVDLNNAFSTSVENFGRAVRLADFSAQHQRFYEMPTVTIHEQGSRFGAISLASGNRSFPLDKGNGYDHRVYVLHDYDLGATNLFNNEFNKIKDLNESSLINWNQIGSNTINQFTSKAKKGWYYTLTKSGDKDEVLNTGTVKALNGYLAVANTSSFSDLYVSLYNPNDSSSQQPNTCSGGINGASRTLKLCLPFGVCGDISVKTDVETKKIINLSTTKTDGISKLNIVPIKDSNGKNKTTLLGGGYTQYMTTRIFKPYNWFELQ